MKLRLLVLTGLFFLFSLPVFSEPIKVGLEPLPPFVNEDGSGLSIELLKKAEKHSGVSFEITIMPYSRAKSGLKNGVLDLMGHTPYKLEEKDFYTYAVEVNWSMPAFSDLYAVNKEVLEPARLKQLKRIGVPFGNAAFFSEVLKIPKDHFHEGKIRNILKMLDRGRLDALLFERAASMSSIRQYKPKNTMYYKMQMAVPVSFAVQKNEAGNDLRKRLEKAFQKVNQKRIFKDYMPFTKLPEEGVVQ